MRLYIYPPTAVSVTVPPIAFTIDGVSTPVNIDTGTPANSEPLPVISYNASGVVITPATEAKQDSQITEATSTNTKLDTIIAKDFSTETTLEAARVLLASIAGEDFATQTTLAALLTELQLKADLSETQPVSAASLPLPTGAATEAKQDSGITQATSTNTKLDTLIAKDFATEVTLEAARVLLASIAGEDFATQTTLAALLTELQLKADLSETQPVSIAAAPSPAITAGTITSAQVAVGTSAVRATVDGNAPNASRKKLLVKPSASNTGKIFIGASGVTTANALEIIGPDRLEFEFDSGDYYLISDTDAQVVEILEKV